MQLSRERKAYASVLVLGLIALGIDRFVIGPPTAAGADEYSVRPEELSQAGAEPPEPLVHVVKPAQQPAAISLGQRLRRFENAGSGPDITDLFQLPPAWRPAEREPTAVRPPPGLSAAEQFQRRRLNGVLVETTGPDRRQAIVDGQVIVVGQSLDGFRLVEVTQRSAVFEGNGHRVVLQTQRVDAP